MWVKPKTHMDLSLLNFIKWDEGLSDICFYNKSLILHGSIHQIGMIYV